MTVDPRKISALVGGKPKPPRPFDREAVGLAKRVIDRHQGKPTYEQMAFTIGRPTLDLAIKQGKLVRHGDTISMPGHAGAPPSADTKRDKRNGKYTFHCNTLCVCGHAEHTAEAPHHCIAADFHPIPVCRCERYRPTKIPRPPGTRY